MRKDLGARAFGFGWPVPVLMVATYNDDGSVNVMNMHEAMRTNAGDLALCIGPRSKTHENVEKRGAFTVALVNREMMAEIDYLGTVIGRNVPDKFARTGLRAVRSAHVDAPIIEGCPVVIECALVEIVNGTNFTTVLARIVNVAAEESVLTAAGAEPGTPYDGILAKTAKIDAFRTGMLFYEPFGTGYVTLGERVGTPWSEGKRFMKQGQTGDAL